MNNNKRWTISIDFDIGLFIVFLVLKLCGVISWSWWWVCAPLWGPVALVIVIAVISLLVLGISTLCELIYNYFCDRRK